MFRRIKVDISTYMSWRGKELNKAAKHMETVYLRFLFCCCCDSSLSRVALNLFDHRNGKCVVRLSSIISGNNCFTDRMCLIMFIIVSCFEIFRIWDFLLMELSMGAGKYNIIQGDSNMMGKSFNGKFRTHFLSKLCW